MVKEDLIIYFFFFKYIILALEKQEKAHFPHKNIKIK